ncbi:hypothetical protein ACSAZL_03575 [Methanosarcina sp. T3]|uniref:hypothetical protein n=1 Tax=Methanosarcina sp. T3 TaxID=3439062 RepID=UPI003F83C0BE
MGHYIVRIHASTWDLLRDLQRLHDLDVFSKTAKQLDDYLFEIHGLLSDEQIENLSKKGYQIEIIANTAEVAKERRKGVPGLSLSPGDRSDRK